MLFIRFKAEEGGVLAFAFHPPCQSSAPITSYSRSKIVSVRFRTCRLPATFSLYRFTPPEENEPIGPATIGFPNRSLGILKTTERASFLAKRSSIALQRQAKE